MNSLERVISVIEGKTPDRRPVSMIMSLYGAALTGCPLEKYYGDSQAYFYGQSAVKENFPVDFLFSPFALSLEAEAFGSKIQFGGNNPPTVIKPAVNSVRDFLKLPLPDIDSSPGLVFIKESVDLLVKHYGKEKAIVAILLSPPDLPPLVMGIDMWLEAILFDTEGARKILDMTSRFFIEWANSLLAQGVFSVACPIAFSLPSVIEKKKAKELILPLYEEIFKEIKGPIVLHHGGYPAGDCLDYYINLPNVAAFVLDHRDDLEKARKKAGETKVLMGNINAVNLNKYRTEEIKNMTDRILTDRTFDPYFILSASGPDIPFDTPPENIMTICETAACFTQ